MHGGEDTSVGRAVTQKIRASALELRNEIPEGYVALNSHVIFRVDGRPPIGRTLVHWNDFIVPGLDLSVATPWGVTLLGLKVGHEAVAYWRGGIAERIKVESVSPGRQTRRPGAIARAQ